jgi:hypothetical protein
MSSNRRLSLFTGLALLYVLLGAGQPARAQDQPTVAKDSIWVTVKGRPCSAQEKGCAPGDKLWFPAVEFRVNGPIPSGSQIWVEFTPPGKRPLKLDCPAPALEVNERQWWKMACGGGDEVDQARRAVIFKGPIYTGLIPFTIRVRNELMQTTATLFTGQLKNGSYKPSPNATEPTYYVDEDWRIPIGYIGFETSPAKQGVGERFEKGDDSDILRVAFTLRGNPGDVYAHLFFQGKEISKHWCRVGENSEWNPAKYVWWEFDCKFEGVHKDDGSGGHALSKNPGEYEIKVLSGGKLARSIKFGVGPDGGIDNGIAAANNLGSNRVIVPVQVIGDQGPWNKLAWKTEAYYGNPLTGFAPPQ